jgi:hypothetical protein
MDSPSRLPHLRVACHRKGDDAMAFSIKVNGNTHSVDVDGTAQEVTSVVQGH